MKKERKSYPLTVEEAIEQAAQIMGVAVEEVKKQMPKGSVLKNLAKESAELIPLELTSSKTIDYASFGEGVLVLTVKGKKGKWVIEPASFKDMEGQVVKTIKITSAHHHPSRDGALRGEIGGTDPIKYLELDERVGSDSNQ